MVHSGANRGFTLVELLIVIGIFLIAGIAVLPLYGNYPATSSLNTEAEQLVQTLRLARERALAGWQDDNQGVCFEETPEGPRYILYHGPDCANRVAADDQITTLAPAFTLETDFPNDDINFSSIGEPSAPGFVALSRQVSGERLVTVNSLGAVEEN